MGRFGGSKQTHEYTSGAGGNFTPVGLHRVRVDRCIDKNGYKGQSAIFEFTMLDTDNPDAKVGQQYSQVCNVTKHADAARGNIADFLRTGFQTIAAQEGSFIEWDKVQWTKEDEDGVFEASQDFAGLELGLQVIETKIQSGPNAGKPFNKHVWKLTSELAEKMQAA